MEGIIALIIIIAGIASSLSKSKKVVQNRPGQGTPAQKTPVRPETRAEAPEKRTVYQPKPQTAAPRPRPVQPVAPAAPDKAGQRPMPSLQDLLQSFLGEEEETPTPKPAAVIPESHSPVDEKGCVGGSLPHNAASLHEGESSQKKTPRLEFKHPDTSADFEVQHSNLRVSAEDMRRAVIMAELLGKPKALRPRSDRP